MMKFLKMDKGTKVRTIVLVLALLNQILTSTGLNPVPGTEESWFEIITVIITASASVVAWFRNNYVTARGREQREVLEEFDLLMKK